MVDKIDPVSVSRHYEVPVEDDLDQDIDFDDVPREMNNIGIEISRSRHSYCFKMSEITSKEWQSSVKEQAALYRKLSTKLFTIATVGLNVLQVGASISFGADKDHLKLWSDRIGYAQAGTEAISKLAETLRTGTMTEKQALTERSKLLFERTERETQACEQRTDENHRKAEEARRRKEDIEQAMARA